MFAMSKVEAIGECGLDETAMNKEDPEAGVEEQEALLKKHLDITKRTLKGGKQHSLHRSC